MMISRHFRNKKRRIEKLTQGHLQAHWQPFAALAKITHPIEQFRLSTEGQEYAL